MKMKEHFYDQHGHWPGECDEIADNLDRHIEPPVFSDFHECAAWVRERMPDATEQVKDNVAEAAYDMARRCAR